MVEEVEVPYRESLSSRDMAGVPNSEAVAVGKKEAALKEARILMADDSVEAQEGQYTECLRKTTPGLEADQEGPDTSPSARYYAVAVVAAENVGSRGYLT